MAFLFVLIALSLCAAFLYSLVAMWGRVGRLLLHHGGGRSRKELGGIVVTVLVATAPPAWFAWQVWQAYGS